MCNVFDMSFTVADALELSLIRAAGPHVLTNGTDLDQREVRWVHSSEIPDIARFLSGGELLLTAGLGMGETEAEQRAYVKAVSRAGAAALVIEESGRMFDRVPEAVVQEAQQMLLPVIALTHEVSFAGVSAQVHEILTEMRLRSLTREREVEATFSGLLLDGADHLGIVETLAALTDSTVVLENIAHRVTVYFSVDGVEFDDDEWNRHARVSHDNETDCVRRPVVMRGQPWGWIHVLQGQSPTAPFSAEFAAERAAAAIAISLLTDRSREARDDQRSTALMTHLLLGEISGDEFVKQASRLGYRLGSGLMRVFVANKNTRDDSGGIRPKRRSSPNAISADMGDYIVTVAPEVNGRPPEIEDLVGFVGAGVGVSRAISRDMVAVALTQARSAAAVARASGGVLHFDELGVERILVTLAQGPELASFVEDELGPLLTKDAHSASPLLPTLRAFLSVDGRKTEAADKLYVQRRTLYNRLERISTILGKSLDAPETRQRLLLAVKGLELLEGSAISSSRRSGRN